MRLLGLLCILVSACMLMACGRGTQEALSVDTDGQFSLRVIPSTSDPSADQPSLEMTRHELGDALRIDISLRNAEQLTHAYFELAYDPVLFTPTAT